jgi:uncharacterized phosphosugar-binding protein
MMEAFELFQDQVFKKLTKAFSQVDKILQAGDWIAESMSENGWIYICGTGHSHLLAEEIFYRAGGFARVIPILDPPLMLHESASRSTEIERKEGYALEVMKLYTFTEKDIFIIASNSGRNAFPVELAFHAKSHGAKTLAITNLTHSSQVDSRHSSSKKLYQVVDMFLDNYGEIGDAAVSIPGLKSKIGATSTIIGASLLQAIIVQAASQLLKKGIQPEIFSSSNSDDDQEVNQSLLATYQPFIKNL